MFTYLDNYEATHDYDEYHFDLDEIVHDPYVLISILTAYHQGEWTLAEVEGTLSMLFERQYILTEEVVVETRYPAPLNGERKKPLRGRWLCARNLQFHPIGGFEIHFKAAVLHTLMRMTTLC